MILSKAQFLDGTLTTHTMISDFDSLIDPIAEAEFLTLLRERKLTFLPGSGLAFETLLNWETLNHLLDSSTYPLQQLRVMRESVPIPKSLYVKQGRVDPAALLKLLDQGVSLIFNQVDEHVPALRALCKNIAQRTSEQISVAAIVTSGRGGALECHYDNEDVVILQIAGTKRWQVFGDPMVNPVPGSCHQELILTARRFSIACCSQAIFSFCRRGIGITARMVHIALSTSVSFSMPPNGRHLITALVSQLSSDETFRRPLTRHSSPEAMAEHEMALKKRLVDAIQAISLGPIS